MQNDTSHITSNPQYSDEHYRIFTLFSTCPYIVSITPSIYLFAWCAFDFKGIVCFHYRVTCSRFSFDIPASLSILTIHISIIWGYVNLWFADVHMKINLN